MAETGVEFVAAYKTSGNLQLQLACMGVCHDHGVATVIYNVCCRAQGFALRGGGQPQGPQTGRDCHVEFLWPWVPGRVIIIGVYHGMAMIIYNVCCSGNNYWG